MLIQNFASDIERFPIYFYTLSYSHKQEDIYRPNGIDGLFQILIVKDGSGILECADGKKIS